MNVRALGLLTRLSGYEHHMCTHKGNRFRYEPPRARSKNARVLKENLSLISTRATLDLFKTLNHAPREQSGPTGSLAGFSRGRCVRSG